MFFETSAKTNDGIDDMFIGSTEKILKDYDKIISL